MNNIIIGHTEDVVIKYNDLRGYYVEDRTDVCVIEFGRDSEMLQRSAAIDALKRYVQDYDKNVEEFMEEDLLLV